MQQDTQQAMQCDTRPYWDSHQNQLITTLCVLVQLVIYLYTHNQHVKGGTPILKVPRMLGC